MAQFVDRAAVGKRENAGNAVADLNDSTISTVCDSFDRIGECFAVKPGRVGENIGDRGSAKITVIEFEGHAGQQNPHAPLRGHVPCLIGVHAAADGFFDLLRDEGFPRRLDLFAESPRRRGLAPLQFLMFDSIEVSTCRPCVERRTVMDCGLALFLLQRRLKVRAGLEDKPLRRAHHAIGDRSFE
jgi:hypothetical protein